MNPRALLLVMAVPVALFAESSEAASSGECTDFQGQTIPNALLYVPGPDACTVCVCDNGAPKWCQAVLCGPPQDCRSFRVGQSCCEFVCLDDTLPTDGSGRKNTTDLGLRLVASAVTAVLSLSLLFFLILRLRQRRIRGRQNRQFQEDQRSLESVGYITGSLGYLTGCVSHLNGREQVDFLYDEPPSQFPFWKPPENYFSPGEAPPPYEEAVAAAQAEAASVVTGASSGNCHEVEEQGRHNNEIAVITRADSTTTTLTDNALNENTWKDETEVSSFNDMASEEGTAEAFDVSSAVRSDVQVHVNFTDCISTNIELPDSNTSQELDEGAAAVCVCENSPVSV